jgi:hypothetical protein
VPTSNVAKLTVEATGIGTSREMLTLKLQGTHVASISFHEQTDRIDTKKSGFWVQYIDLADLTHEQKREIEAFVREQVGRHIGTMFAGQK